MGCFQYAVHSLQWSRCAGLSAHTSCWRSRGSRTFFFNVRTRMVRRHPPTHWCACSHRHTYAPGTTPGAHHIIHHMLQPQGLPRANRNGEIKHSLALVLSHEAHNTSLHTLAQTQAITSPIISQMRALRFREVNSPRVTRPGASCRDPSLPPLCFGLCSPRRARAAAERRPRDAIPSDRQSVAVTCGAGWMPTPHSWSSQRPPQL